MKNPHIQLLSRRIEKLDEPDFNLEAWKSGTIAVLERIFGEQGSYQKKIEELRVDYGSWALRDATSKYNPTETCKQKGKDLLETIIDDLEVFGPPSKEQSVEDIISAHFPKSKDKLLKAIEKRDEKALAEMLNKEKKEKLVNLILDIL